MALIYMFGILIFDMYNFVFMYFGLMHLGFRI